MKKGQAQRGQTVAIPSSDWPIWADVWLLGYGRLQHLQFNKFKLKIHEPCNESTRSASMTERRLRVLQSGDVVADVPDVR